mgnify:CR=1 FL=1
MDLYYRGYDPASPITSGAQHLSAAAARFAMSIVLSIPQLPDAAWAEFQRLLTVNALWSLCLILAGWVIATVIGGLVGLAVNAILVVYGLVELWKQIQEAGHELRDWAVTTYNARNEAELDVAAQHFATALTKGGITLLEVVVTHRIFRTVEGRLRDRFPTPEWLGKQYEQAAKLREEAPRPREPETSLDKVRRAAEKLAQLYTQVAGRAGRGGPASRARLRGSAIGPRRGRIRGRVLHWDIAAPWRTRRRLDLLSNGEHGG